MSKFVGESEKGVREVFKTAKQASPAIIFFDEIDAVVPRRGSGVAESGVTERVVSQFLAEMDGIEELKGVVVLAATNRLDMIDPALLRGGRFDLVIALPLPDEDTRFSVFGIHTKNKPLGKDVDLRDLAKETVGMAGSDIEFICRKASTLTIREYINHTQNGKRETRNAQLTISRRHFEEALRLVQKQKESISAGQGDA
jgi:transitional endoplasmic reticulum ATPase